MPINFWFVSCNLIAAILTSRYKKYDSLMIGSVVDMHTRDDELMLTKLVESRGAFVECEFYNAVPKLWRRELVYKSSGGRSVALIILKRIFQILTFEAFYFLNQSLSVFRYTFPYPRCTLWTQ